MTTINNNIEAVRAELKKGLRENTKFKRLITIIRESVPGGPAHLTDAVIDEIYAEAVTQVILLNTTPPSSVSPAQALYDYFSGQDLDNAAPSLRYQLEGHGTTGARVTASVKGVTIPDIKGALESQNIFNITAFFNENDFNDFDVDTRDELGRIDVFSTNFNTLGSGKIAEGSFLALAGQPNAREKLTTYMVTNLVVSKMLNKVNQRTNFFNRGPDSIAVDFADSATASPDSVINSIFNLFIDFPSEFVKETDMTTPAAVARMDIGNPYVDDGTGVRAANSFRTSMNQLFSIESGPLKNRVAVTVTESASGQIGEFQNPENATKALEAVETLKIHTQCLLLQNPDVMASKYNKCYPQSAFQNQSGAPAMSQTPVDMEELNNVETAIYSAAAAKRNETTNIYTDTQSTLEQDPGWSVDSRGQIMMHCKDVATRPKNFTAIDVLKPGASSMFLNSLSADRTANKLNKIPNKLHSFATPYVNFYIVKYDSANKPISIRLPFNEEASVTREDLIRQNKISIQDFQIKFLGTNPAEVESYVKASATFNIPTFSSMGHPRNGNSATVDGKEYQARFIDLITRSTQVSQFPGSQEPAETLSKDSTRSAVVNPLIENQVENKSKEQYKDKWDPRHFQVKIEYGLNEISKTDWSVLFTKREQSVYPLDKINETIRANRIQAYLTLMTHTISIDEKWQDLTMKVEYIGHIESMLRSHMADVFKNDTRDQALIKSHRAALKELQEQKKGFALVSTSEDGSKKATRELTKLQESIDGIEKNMKLTRWSGLLTSLIDNDKVYSVKVDSDDMGLKFDVSNSQTTLTVANGRQNASILESAAVLSGAAKKDLTKKFQIQKSITEEELNTLSVQSSTSKFDKSLRTFKFHYFYLGDLIDVAIENIKAQNTHFKIGNNNADLQFVVGPYDYFDPVTHSPKVVNIADLPISLDLYYSWFIKRVIKPDRSRYNLAQFIRDIISDLITSIMAEDCLRMPENTLKMLNAQYRRPKFSASLLNISDSKIPPNAPSRMLMPGGGIFWDSKTDKRRTSYYVIYASSSNSNLNLAGNKRQDEDRGIVHLNLSTLDIGVLSSAKFKKTDIPYMGEARVLQDSVTISQFRDKYDVDIVCHGNNIFRPGQYFFLETADKTGEPIRQEGSWARTFGFGGYYLVNSVTHKINFSQVSNFVTSLEGIWQSAGASTLKI